MKGMEHYITEHLTKPVRVCVVDNEDAAAGQIEDALSVYKCEVSRFAADEFAHGCPQEFVADLAFISADMGAITCDIIDCLKEACPKASTVVMTRTPASDEVAAVMGHGAYTFLLKNGSFTEEHVSGIFRQLNVKLRSKQGGGQFAASSSVV